MKILIIAIFLISTNVYAYSKILTNAVSELLVSQEDSESNCLNHPMFNECILKIQKEKSYLEDSVEQNRVDACTSLDDFNQCLIDYFEEKLNYDLYSEDPHLFILHQEDLYENPRGTNEE